MGESLNTGKEQSSLDTGHEQNSVLIKTLHTLILAILIIFLVLIIYLLYYNMPGSPKDAKIVIGTPGIIENQNFSEAKQFYPNMKFNHNNLTYQIDPGCADEKKQRAVEAFNMLSRLIPSIKFSSTQTKPDIEVSCSEQIKQSVEESSDELSYFIAGEGGAKEIVQTGKYNVITEGIILLYKENKNAVKCDWPNIELHELMHVFGFNHTQDPNRLMHPYLSSCDQQLDDSIISELKRLYAEPNLPDLYFEKVGAIKKGRYLDFNITVKNSGTRDVRDAEFSVLDNGDLIDTKALGNITYGGGIYLEIKNFRLKHRNPKEIQFIINKDHLIEELDFNNNIATIKFS